MFDDLLSGATAQQKELDQKLAQQQITKKSHDNLFELTINAKKEILDIKISKVPEDIAELEDNLVITLNEAMHDADKIVEAETSGLLKSMLDGGFGNIFG